MGDLKQHYNNWINYFNLVEINLKPIDVGNILEMIL